MKRLVTTLLLSTALVSGAAFAVTPTERDMNDFGNVSTIKSSAPAKPAEAAPSTGYNKSVTDHKTKGKKGAKKATKKGHAKKKKAAAESAPAN